MGIDASVAIRFKYDPTEKQLGQLGFHLLHRFGSIINTRAGQADTFKPFIIKAAYDLGENDEISAEDGLLYEVELMPRYYGPGYERGPGLEISALLIYLCRRTDIISQVYYGGDGNYIEYTEEKAISLFDHWIAEGELPYRHFFSRLGRSHSIPECKRCFMPMVEFVASKDYITWGCVACGEQIKTPRI